MYHTLFRMTMIASILL